MKRLVSVVVMALLACLLAGCSGEAAPWSRVGSYTDPSGNFLSVTQSDDKDQEGFYVGILVNNQSYGAVIAQEGDALSGTLVSGDEGEDITVTVKEEDEEGLELAIEGGDTYHLTPIEQE